MWRNFLKHVKCSHSFPEDGDSCKSSVDSTYNLLEHLQCDFGENTLHLNETTVSDFGCGEALIRPDLIRISMMTYWERCST